MSLIKRFRSLLAREELERDMNDELQHHLELKTQEFIEAGMSPEEARYGALRAFGGVEQMKEACRDADRLCWIEDLTRDLRYGLRQLRRNPGFTVAAIVMLALGIGASTAIFSVVNAVLVCPLPYPAADRIVDISPYPCCSDSIPMFVYWEQNNPGFQDLSAYGDQAYAVINLGGGDRPEQVEARRVSFNYFSLFGAVPILGRTFAAEEDRPGGPAVAVLSYGLWQARFGRNPAILGKAILLGGAPYTVIGVLSPDFKPYPPTEVWIPLQADPNSTNQAHTLMVAGRLPPGVTLAQANSWMAVIEKRYFQVHPQHIGADEKLQVESMQWMMTEGIRPTLLILLGAVGLVLLIVCANIANLLLARGAGRQREIAVRTAVGAGRGRIIRQLLAENVLLALAGGAAGLLAGVLGVPALLALAPANAYAPGQLPVLELGLGRISALDPWVTGFAVLLTLVTGLLFGFFPALSISRPDLTASLKEPSGQRGVGPKHGCARVALMTGEVATAFVLLCGAVLLIRSLAALAHQRLGVDPHNLLTAAVSLAGPRYSQSRDVSRLAREAIAGIDRIPGVESAAMASALPLWGGIDMIFDIPGRPPPKGDRFTGDIEWRIVSPQYFETLRIPLLSGRLLRDHEPGRTVIINEAMARRFWPDSNPLGRSIIIGPSLGPQYEEGAARIIGIVGNVRSWTLAQPFEPTMYQLASQIPDAAMTLINRQWPAAFIVRIKPGVPPMSLSHAVQQLLLAREGLAPAKMRTMEQVVEDSIGSQRFTLLLMGIFAATALLLAAIGLYGVISYWVRARTHEIGIRIALGAQAGEVQRMVLGEGLRLALMGLAVGVVCAFALTCLLASLLYAVKPADPITFLGVSVVLTGVALLACYLPARRATKIDPMVALRHE